MSSNQQPPPELRHFLRLAKAGSFRGSSCGEKAARKLAQAIVRHCPGLDDQALAGMQLFVRCAAFNPIAAREFLALQNTRKH
jgi:hypothetical protein